MAFTRRLFLAGSAGAAAAPAAFAAHAIPLGLQLYTVRDALAQDFAGTLQQVRAIGIARVQSNLTLNGHDAQALRRIFGSLGLAWDSIHAGGEALRSQAQQTIDQARAAGIRNITCALPLYPTDFAAVMAGPSRDDWLRTADACNRLGRRAAMPD